MHRHLAIGVGAFCRVGRTAGIGNQRQLMYFDVVFKPGIHPAFFTPTAPIDRAVSVGNVVRRPQDRPLKVKGVRVPRFIGRIFNLENKEAVGDFDSLMSMDDECYMGKDGAADDCVDFDPPTKSP